jgi:hypothetical protein
MITNAEIEAKLRKTFQVVGDHTVISHDTPRIGAERVHDEPLRAVLDNAVPPHDSRHRRVAHVVLTAIVVVALIVAAGITLSRIGSDDRLTPARSTATPRVSLIDGPAPPVPAGVVVPQPVSQALFPAGAKKAFKVGGDWRYGGIFDGRTIWAKGDKTSICTVVQAGGEAESCTLRTAFRRGAIFGVTSVGPGVQGGQAHYLTGLVPDGVTRVTIKGTIVTLQGNVIYARLDGVSLPAKLKITTAAGTRSLRVPA